MSYCAASDVSALCRSLIGPSASFDTSTCPSLAEVTAWLTSGCSVIDTKLASYGYGSVPTNSTAYGLAQSCNAQFGAWQAEQSRLNARISPGERTRSDTFKKSFFDLLDLLCTLDLSRAGVSVSTSGRAYAGGISISDKQSVESDGDRVKPRFARDMGKNPERDSWKGATESGTGAGTSDDVGWG